jgi:hypothetical protein
MACELPSHQHWYQDYLKRFSRLTWGTVTRIIRRTVNREHGQITGAQQTNSTEHPSLTNLHPQLPQGPHGEDGGAVVHRFRAGTTYCVQTLQWACGVPIGWGKCYDSEGVSQVFAILNRLFPEQDPQSRPSFLFYDNACRLLAHIVTHHQTSSWLQSTRFLVDAWHYVNHRATDQLCRFWCNPAPADGSQPDLVITKEENGQTLTVRAYNTETAEQLNAWLTAFEVPMRQMTNYNFDFFMHTILFLYGDLCSDRNGPQANQTPVNHDDGDDIADGAIDDVIG